MSAEPSNGAGEGRTGSKGRPPGGDRRATDRRLESEATDRRLEGEATDRRLEGEAGGRRRLDARRPPARVTCRTIVPPPIVRCTCLSVLGAAEVIWPTAPVVVRCTCLSVLGAAEVIWRAGRVFVPAARLTG